MRFDILVDNGFVLGFWLCCFITFAVYKLAKEGI